MITIVSDDPIAQIAIATPLRRSGLEVWTTFGGKIKNQIKRSPQDTLWLIIIENNEIKLRNTGNKRQETLTADQVIEGLTDVYFDTHSDDGPEYMHSLYTTLEDLCSK